MTAGRIYCPVENHTDRIEKASQIVDTQTGAFSGTMQARDDSGWSYSAPVTGTSSTRLAQLLVLPPAPQKDRKILQLVVGFVLLLYSAQCLILGALTLCLGPFYVYTAISEAGPLGFAIFPVLILLAVVFGLPGFLGIRFLRRRYRVMRQEVEEKYQAEKADWDRAKAVWDRLHYCYTHSVVFDPVTGETCRPEDARSFIYKTGP